MLGFWLLFFVVVVPPPPQPFTPTLPASYYDTLKEIIQLQSVKLEVIKNAFLVGWLFGLLLGPPVFFSSSV